MSSPDSSSLAPVKPFIKWAGGKRRLLGEILPHLQVTGGRYFEPFLGAGAVFLAIGRDVEKIGNDTNTELVNAWLSIRDNPQGIIEVLKTMENSAASYKQIREWDRSDDWQTKRTQVERAARTIYLNKTCFNGLYRVNSKGQFNVPFSNRQSANGKIIDEATIYSVSDYLLAKSSNNRAPIIGNSDFKDCVATARAGDVVYFDPPYLPINKKSSFVSYSPGGFSEADHETLRDVCVSLIQSGVKTVISNSDTRLTRLLFGDKKYFRIVPLSVRRSVGAGPETRVMAEEVLILGKSR
jgi:DNA adenine methylase